MTSDDDTDNFRESYSSWDYESYTWEDENGASKTWCPCKASLDMPKIGRDDAMFTEYTVEVGQRVYDAVYSTTHEVLSETTFTYTLE